jgi:hypothetical protein
MIRQEVQQAWETIGSDAEGGVLGWSGRMHVAFACMGRVDLEEAKETTKESSKRILKGDECPCNG